MQTFDTIKTRLESFIVDYSNKQGVSLDLAPGSVLSEWVVKLSAALDQEITNNAIDDIASTNTVKAAIESVVDTYNPLMDSIASNYNVERDTGTTAAGKIKVTVTSERTYYLPSSLTFNQPTLNVDFQTLQAYTVKTNPTPNTPNELKLYTSSAGVYYFILPVQAVVPAAIDNNFIVSHNAEFSVATDSTIPTFVSARAYGDFSGGKAPETDKQLIARFKEGLSCRGVMSAYAIKSLLSEQLNQSISVSVVGSNDAEFTRTKHNAFGITTLGAADVYVRTSAAINTVDFTTTAVWASNRWLLGISQSSTVDAPSGFYNILGISNAATGANYNLLTGFPVFTPQILYENTNLITTGVEARYSAYQICGAAFTAPHTPGTDTMEVKVLVSYMPYIQEMQDFLLQSSQRVIAADYLIKAIIPCMVSMTLNLHKKSSAIALPVNAIKKDIFNYINGLQLGEDLVVSKIVDICHNYDVQRVDLPVYITGTIWTPYTDMSKVITINATDVLRIPNTDASKALGVSPKTTAFFATYLDASGVETPTINIVEI